MSTSNGLVIDEQEHDDGWLAPSGENGLMEIVPVKKSFRVFPSTQTNLAQIASYRNTPIDVAVQDALATLSSVDLSITDGATFFVQDRDGETLRALPWSMIPRPESTDDSIELEVELDSEAEERLQRLLGRYGQDPNKVLNIAAAVENFFVRIQEGGYKLGVRRQVDGPIEMMSWRFPVGSAEELLSNTIRNLKKARVVRSIAASAEEITPQPDVDMIEPTSQINPWELEQTDVVS